MTNKSVSDFVAASMDAALKSAEYKSLFGTQYKFASDENDAKKCPKCNGSMVGDKCSCGDSMMADDDNDARRKKKEEDEKSSSSSDSSDADDNDAKKKKGLPPWLKKKEDGESSDEHSAEDEEFAAEAQFNIAIDGLLTASAALDSIGMIKSSTLSLQLASLVVEAKAKKKDSSKDSKKSDSNDAKDKAVKEKAKAKAKEEAEKAKAKKRERYSNG